MHQAYAAKRKVNTGARTLQLMHLRLCQALDLAVSWQLVAKNVARLIDTPQAPPKPHQVWTPAEQGRFLAAAAKEHHHPLWHVLITTGLRRGELLGLRWADLDLARQHLRVEQQVVMVGTRLEITSVKTEKSRRLLELPPSLMPCCWRIVSGSSSALSGRSGSGRITILSSPLVSGGPSRRAMSPGHSKPSVSGWRAGNNAP